jgi:hypothetical protein
VTNKKQICRKEKHVTPGILKEGCPILRCPQRKKEGIISLGNEKERENKKCQKF